MYARYIWLAGVTYCHGSFKLRQHVYEQPRTTVCQLEEICGLIAASGTASGKTLRLDNGINWTPTEENPEGEIDAKENTLGTTLWND